MAEKSKTQLVMPVWSSPLGQGPHPMERAEMLIIECIADADELARVTPSFCEPGQHNRVRVFFTNNSQPPNSLSFREVGLIQEVRYGTETVQTMPYLWVSDDMAMLGGRELFGMPKLLMDDIPVEIHANQLFGRLARNGVTMMEGSMVVERAAQADEMSYSELASVYERHIPNPDPAKPSYRQLIRLTVAHREVIGQCWLGRGHVEVRHPLHSRLDRLKLQATERAWYAAFRWNLPHGEIVEEGPY